MSQWPATRVTLLDRLRDPGDQDAWAEFVGLYGPLLFQFARRRLPQDDDAADVLQDVLSAVLAVPEIKELALEETEERTLFARLGTMQHDTPARFILDLTLPRRPDGKYVVAQLEVTYDPGTGQRLSSGPVQLEMTYAATGHSHANAEVMKHIDEIQLKELNDQLQIALQKNDPQAAQQMAREIVKKGKQMGPGAARKTMIAQQVMQELKEEGHVARKTQLELDNAVRLAGDEAAGVAKRPIASEGHGLEER